VTAELRLRELLDRLTAAEVRFVIVGGLAVNAWGHVRGTQDVDLGPVDVLQGLPQIPPFSQLDQEAVAVDLGGHRCPRLLARRTACHEACLRPPAGS
jgi:hypothetical protein